MNKWFSKFYYELHSLQHYNNMKVFSPSDCSIARRIKTNIQRMQYRLASKLCQLCINVLSIEEKCNVTYWVERCFPDWDARWGKWRIFLSRKIEKYIPEEKSMVESLEERISAIYSKHIVGAQRMEIANISQRCLRLIS